MKNSRQPLRKMTIRHSILLIIMASLWAAACGRSDGNPVPRPVAYPRIERYTAQYDTINAGKVALPVNAFATTDIRQKDRQNTWINVGYPRYRATLRYTLSRLKGEELSRAIENRLTRMSLNAGGNMTEIIELQSLDGIKSTILVTPGAVVTPVQILSTDSTGIMLSGVLEINSTTATPEEISPVVAAVKDDLLYTAKHISRQ